MRTSIFAISALVLVTLVGCSTGAPASPIAPPTATQTPPSSVVVEPTLLSPATITPTIENGFSIYLLAQNIPPEQLVILSHLELEIELSNANGESMGASMDSESDIEPGKTWDFEGLTVVYDCHGEAANPATTYKIRVAEIY